MGYWWLEQTDWARGHQRPWRRVSDRFRRAGTAMGDGWSDLTHAVRRRPLRLRRAPARPARRPVRPAVTAWLAGVGSASGRALRAPATRWLLLTAVAALVVGGALAAGFRLPGAGTPTDQAQLRSDTVDADASGGARGPGLSRPGIHLSVSPTRSGELAVVERIITPRPISVLPLAAPPRVPRGDGPDARLTDLVVAADDVVVPVGGSGEVGQERELSLPRPATTFELRYRVVDAVERSASAPPERVTLSLRPAASGALETSPAVVQVRGVAVHALVCLDAPPEQQLCGVDDRGGWHTEPVTAATSSVLALVDLPHPERGASPGSR